VARRVSRLCAATPFCYSCAGWRADNAIKLAVEMTVASIGQLDLTGDPDQQAMQVRDAIRVLFPEAVTLVREAREGLS
jgi:hypothetical protein